MQNARMIFRLIFINRNHTGSKFPRPAGSSTGFTVQGFFSEQWAVKIRFFLSRLGGLSMDNGSWLWVETVNPEP